MMKKIFQLCAALFVLVSTTGCYDDFDAPATEEAFAQMTRLTIQEVKDMFIVEHGTISGTGQNDSWNDTKFTVIPDDEDYYIKGKVLSSDEEGNVYKSLHICDETGAIEIKLSTGLYLDYPVGTYDWETGTMDTHYVYVKVSGLYIGNYRMMLSIGNGPTDSFNVLGDHNYYANSNIENPSEIKERVILGRATKLHLGEEILEITPQNYQQFFGEDNVDKLGRLVILRDVVCHYGMMGTNIYPSWMNTNVAIGSSRESKAWYKWAVSELFTTEGTQNSIYCNLYGSVLFSYTADMPSSTKRPGVYTIRTSGYARFAKRPIVRDGAKGDILAIYGIYSKSWDYNYLAYQCTVNRFSDIHFDESDFLTSSEVRALTPNGYPDNDPANGEYNPVNDSWTTKQVAGEFDNAE